MINAKRGAPGEGTPSNADDLLPGKINSNNKTTAPQTQAFNWRDHLAVHPAADLFPMMSAAELKELGEDIKKNDLRVPIALWECQEGKKALLDGRSRLSAMELVGIEIRLDSTETRLCYRRPGGPLLLFPAFELRSDEGDDPYAYVISANIHRRHLTAEQKQDLIAKLLKAAPQKSNRQVAKTVGVSHPHVAKVRQDLEKAGDVETVTTSIDTKGRKQPAKKQTQPKTSTSPDGSRSGVSQVSAGPEKLSSGLPTGSDSSELVPCSPAERRAAKKYEQEQDEIMRVEAERLVEKLIKTDIESARSLYRILDSANFPALIFTLRDALEREFDGEDDGLDIPESLRRVAP